MILLAHLPIVSYLLSQSLVNYGFFFGNGWFRGGRGLGFFGVSLLISSERKKEFSVLTCNFN